jgi:hypothetical protein
MREGVDTINTLPPRGRDTMHAYSPPCTHVEADGPAEDLDGADRAHIVGMLRDLIEDGGA